MSTTVIYFWLIACLPTIASLGDEKARRTTSDSVRDDSGSDSDADVDTGDTGSDSGMDSGAQPDTAGETGADTAAETGADTAGFETGDTGNGCGSWGDLTDGIDGASWTDVEVGERIFGMYQVTGSGDICSASCDHEWHGSYGEETGGLQFYVFLAPDSATSAELPITVVDGMTSDTPVHVMLDGTLPYDGSERGLTTTCTVETSNGNWTAAITAANH